MCPETHIRGGSWLQRQSLMSKAQVGNSDTWMSREECQGARGWELGIVTWCHRGSPGTSTLYTMMILL